MSALEKRIVRLKAREQDLEIVVVSQNSMSKREANQLRREYPKGTFNGVIFAYEIDYDLKGVEEIVTAVSNNYPQDKKIPSPIMLVIKPTPEDKIAIC